MANLHINEVRLAGTVVDVDAPTMIRGKEATSLRMVTEQTYRDGQNIQQFKRDIHRVIIFNTTLSSLAARFARAGRRVYVQGELRVRKHEHGTSVEVELGPVGAKFVFLDDPPEQRRAPNGNDASAGVPVEQSDARAFA